MHLTLTTAFWLEATSLFTVSVAGINTSGPAYTLLETYEFWAPLKVILITLQFPSSVTTWSITEKALSYKTNIFPKVTFSTSAGNFISITGFLNKLYLASFDTKVAVKFTWFNEFAIKAFLSIDKSTFVSVPFICVSLLSEKLYTISCSVSISSVFSVSSISSVSVGSTSTLFMQLILVSVFIVVAFKSTIVSLIAFLFSIFIVPTFSGFDVLIVKPFTSLL